MALLGILTASSVPAVDDVRCDGNTIQINQCLADELTAIEAEHQRYVAAARARLKHDADPGDPGSVKAVEGFEKAEAAWLAYRDAECGAVFDNWSGGTIRNAMAITCRATLTHLRTHTVWENWLTFMDSTPPVLLEPMPQKEE